LNKNVQKEVVEKFQKIDNRNEKEEEKILKKKKEKKRKIDKDVNTQKQPLGTIRPVEEKRAR
jgi:hypothetical protein